MSSTVERLTADMKMAMKTKDKNRLTTIRMALAAFQQKEIDDKIGITDEIAIAIISKMIKQRKESADQYQKADRAELADKELYEISVLEGYLPKALSEDEIIEIIQKAILEVGASSVKDMGKIMQAIKIQLTGRADMTKVGSMVKSQLS
ncbi:MAG: GatB/YqeY domain-containing protein [Francisellaceae bacterium]